MSYEDPVNQRSMVLDDWRNSFYERALASLVTPESIVLDAGSGLGVLGFIAASLGAKKVYMVEPKTNLEAARLIARANGLEDRVELIKGTIEQAVIPEKVDIITSVFTGNFLLDEDLLPVLFRARDKYLKAGGVLLPGRGRMSVVPVSIQEYYDQQIGCWRNSPGRIAHSEMHRYAVNQIYYDSFGKIPFQQLAKEASVTELDFHSANSASCDSEITITVTDTGALHGFLGWFDMSFEGQWLSTSPEAKPTHWSQAYLPVDPVIEVAPGDILHLRLTRPQNGNWSWSLTSGELKARHSTFLSQPFTPAEVSRKSDKFKPVLSPGGEAAAFVLRRFDGQQDVRSLAKLVLAEFPDLLSSEEAALEFVMKQSERFGE